MVPIPIDKKGINLLVCLKTIFLIIRQALSSSILPLLRQEELLGSQVGGGFALKLHILTPVLASMGSYVYLLVYV